MLATFGDHGKGPHELSSPGSLVERRPEKGGPVLFDFGNQRFVFLSLEPPAAPGVDSTLPIDMGTTLLEPAAIGEGYVANLLSAQHGLVFLDGSGAPVRKIRTPPAFPRGDAPSISAFLELNQSSVIARPRGDRFAVAYHHRNRIDFFEAESGYLWSVSGPGAVHTSYEVDENRGSLVFSAEDERAYISGAATDRYLYLLRCGTCNLEDPPTRIHVFNWSGELVRVLSIDHGVLRFGVSADDSFLVGSKYRDGMLVQVARWTLPSDLREDDRKPEISAGAPPAP